MENNSPITTPEPANPVQPTATVPTQEKPSLMLPIILMVWPAVTIVAVIILYAIANAIFTSIAGPVNDGELFSDGDNAIRVVMNVILFFFGAAATLAGPPSFIGGLVLLIVRLQKK